jgi:two-component system, NarL family, nitrate/nitrite response regulator NarL
MTTYVDHEHFGGPHLETNGTHLSPGLANGKVATLLVATCHEIAGAGIEVLLRASGHSIVARCSHEGDLLRCSEVYHPDIVILDESVAGEDPAKTISLLRARVRAIIFLIERSDAIKVAGLLDVGLQGIVLSWTRARRIIDCVENVALGRTWVDPDLVRHMAMAGGQPRTLRSLTSREADIAHLVSRGLRNKEIGRRLDLSEGTVKMHLHHIYEKLRIDGRTTLAVLTADAGARMPASANDDRPPPNGQISGGLASAAGDARLGDDSGEGGPSRSHH